MVTGLKPLIGIPCRSLLDGDRNLRFGVLAAYTRAVDLAGGAPILIPLQLSDGTLRDMFARLDGLLLAGGVDIHPKEFGEAVLPACGEIDTARDATELCLTRWALAASQPIFGICRGIQTLNVAAGGSLYQDIGSQLETDLKHNYRVPEAKVLAHAVEIEAGSHVARVLGATHVEVNSLHHQALKEIAPGLRVVARAPDGIVEAVEATDDRFVVGVQFHPEWLLDEDARMVRLFEEFVSSAREYRATKSDGTG
jgi:putative glutamine amidotransferase